MATREEIGLALEVIRAVNQMGEQLRIQATGLQQTNSRIQAIIDDPAKQAILVSGLTALGIDIAALNTDRTAAVAIAQYILDNVPVPTKL